MAIVDLLEFRPIPLRSGHWRAEGVRTRYTIFQSESGFVVHCGSNIKGECNDTPRYGSPRGLHVTYQIAVDACNAHHTKENS